MEIRIDIDEELLNAATDQDRRDFIAGLFFAASRATSEYGAVVDFEDPHHWVITVDDDYESLTRDMLAGREPDPDKESRLRFIRHLNHASEVVASWPAWKRNLLGPSPLGCPLVVAKET